MSIVHEHPLTFGIPPIWANAWGQDEKGPWCLLSIAGAEQILRWVPPGEFMMGSPKDERGRQRTEGPRHWVTISRGFWMFDSPCTQALWQAVMGKNRSHFQCPDARLKT